MGKMKMDRSSSEKSPAQTRNGNNGFSSSLALQAWWLDKQSESQQHPSAAEKWECKEQSLQDTTYSHHSVLHDRALAEWLFLALNTGLQHIEKLEEIDRRIIRIVRGLKTS